MHTAYPIDGSQNASIFPRPTKDDQKMYIGGALELWRGFFSSLRPANGKLIMNFDTTAGVRPLLLSCAYVHFVDEIGTGFHHSW